MNHRFCLFRLMGNFRDKAARTLYFMPGFIGYNKDVAKRMLDLYKDLNNQTLIDAVIDGEHVLDKVNSPSSSSLHGNFLEADGKAAIYFVIQSWAKSLPECADDSPAHVMIKNGNAMERTAPTCRPKWPGSSNALYESGAIKT
uniref:Hexosyltransferase n=1 Tax=Globodera pallida TaxID=36090 RepID=A0A183BUT5_GLOPA